MISDEDLLKAVVDRAREEREDPWSDPRWERLADGTITHAERAELEALAATSPDHAAALAAFTPLSSDFRARVQTELSARPLSTLDEASTSNVIAMSPARGLRTWSTWAGGAIALAAAAAIAVSWVPSRELAAMPAYALVLSDGAQDVRGAVRAEAVPLFFPETTLELILRPSSAVEGEVAAAGVLVGNGVRVRWTPQLDRSEDGVLRVRGATGSVLPVGPGEWTAVIAVGRPADVARAAAALELSDAGAEGVAILRARLRVESARP